MISLEIPCENRKMNGLRRKTFYRWNAPVSISTPVLA